MMVEMWLAIVLDGAWQASLAALVVMTALRSSSRWPVALREGLLLVVILKFLFPPFLGGPGFFSALATLVPSPTAVAGGSPVFAEPAPLPAWMRLLPLIHIAGAGTVVLVVMAGCLRVRAWRRSGRPAGPELDRRAAALAVRVGLTRPVRILVSQHAHVPVATGVLQRLVILPAAMAGRMPADELDAVIAHELVHHRRHHLAVGWLRVAACAIWWWHPLVWMASSTLRSAQEDACDDAVVRSGVIDRAGYCDVLMRAATAASPPWAAMAQFADRLHPLGRRLRRLLEGRAERSLPAMVTPLVVLVTAVLLLPGVSVSSSSPGEPGPADNGQVSASVPSNMTPGAAPSGGIGRQAAAQERAPAVRSERRAAGAPLPAAIPAPSIPEPESLPVIRDVVALGSMAERSIDRFVDGLDRLVSGGPPSARNAPGTGSASLPDPSPQDLVQQRVADTIYRDMVRAGAPEATALRTATGVAREVKSRNRNFWRSLGRGIGRAFDDLFSGSSSPSPSPSDSPSPSPSPSPSTPPRRN